MWPFNIGDCLIEVTVWASLTVYLHVILVTYLLYFHRYDNRVSIIGDNVQYSCHQKCHL